MKTWWLVLFLGVATALPAAELPVVTSGQLAKELRALKPRLPVPARFDDTRYIVIEHRWMTETFLPYFRKFVRRLHMGAPGGEGYDCDNFTYLFRSKLMLSNFLGGGARSGEIPCARLTVAQNRSFGGVPGNSRTRHVVMVVRTDLGWFVVEPQTTVMAPLQDYANLANVVEMAF